MSFFRNRRGSSRDIDPHDWVFPSSFRGLPLKKHSETIIPARSIFRDVSLIQITSANNDSVHMSSYPTAGHVAVHLCLLECFERMRKEMDGAQGSLLQRDRVFQGDTWTLFTRLAIGRFLVWHQNIEKYLERASFYSNAGARNAASNFNKDYLPPLDVLYVWSAYMSRPEAYRRHCPGLSPLCMPWDSILQAMDLDTFTYEIPGVAKQLFRTITKQSADITEYLKSPPAYSQDFNEDFVLDLLEAADIQSNFIDRMHNFLWIRSPALTGTLHRAIARYHQMAQHHADILPTLAEDDPTFELIWKTHLLYPRAFESQMDYGAASIKMESDIEVDCYCWICERIRDEIPTYAHGQPLDITKEQIASVTADVGFYRHVEDFRLTHPPGTALPTRPFTKEELEQQRVEWQKKEEAGRYYGLGYTVKEVRPAIYDKDGKMIKPAKVQVKQDSATKGFNYMIGGAAC